ETVTVAGGIATVTLTDTVAETFAVAITNGAGLTNPSSDSIIVSLGPATQVVITGPGADFATDGSTTLTVQVQAANSNLVTTDSTTTITFDPTLSGTISAVGTGTGDLSYGVVGGAETVTVAGGIATVTLTDTVVETFQVAITNGAGLSNPSSDSITVSAGAADHMVVTATDGSANTGDSEVLSVQLVDQYGNAVSSASAVTVTVTGSATFSATDMGGCTGCQSTSGTLSASGAGSVTITDTVGETVTVSANATGDAEVVANVAASVDFLAKFGYRKSLTIDRTKVACAASPPTTLSNFPVLINITGDLDLRTTTDGGDVTDAQGDDIIFRALNPTTCGGPSVCTLDHEIEQYTSAAG
ncbi:hypothetical protein MYX04_14090, partial [Nitrospiraceae bacterium AH_259_D15_M11_P09]|nr:hypothetical protein [Nitrospiraceae bacterium AH_259_D15_M11_P09]